MYTSLQLLLYCGVLGAGLLLAVDGVITPLWLLISHEHPLTSDIIGECSSGGPLLIRDHCVSL